MKKFVIAVAVVALSLGVVGHAQAQGINVRVGGGALFLDETVWGGAAAVDISISEEMPIAISPFFGFYKKSGTTFLPFGANVLYQIPFSEDQGTFYIGGGAGAFRVSNGGSETAFMADGVGGLKFKIAETISIYGEVQYLYASKKVSGIKVIDLSDIGATVGISFGMGE